MNQPDPRPGRLPRLLASPLEAVAVFLGFLAVACLITAPLALDLDGLFLAGKFQWSHAWAMEMLGDALRGGDSFQLQQMELPPELRSPLLRGLPGPYTLHTELLNWPEGGTIVFLAWFHILLGTLLRDVLPTVGAFNGALLLTLALAPTSAWLLARRLGAGRPGALLGGLVFGFNPYVLGVLANGQVAKVNHAWLAVVALLAWELCRHRRAWAIPALWVTATICLLTSPYYYVFAALLGAGMAAWGLVVQPGWRERATLAGMLLLAGVGMLALHLPVFEHLGTREGGLLSPSTIGSDTSVYELSASLGTLLLPRQLSYPGGVLIPGETHVAYLGLATLLLAGLATWARRDRAVWGWWLVAVAFALLAMGRSATVGGASVPMPLGLLAGLLPPLRALIFVYRGAVVVNLALAMVLALGLGALAVRLGARRWLLWAAPAALALDLLVISPAPFPMPVERLVVPRVYQELARDPRAFGIVEFPCDLEGLEVHGAAYTQALTDLNQRQIFWQAFHRKGLGMVDKGNNHRALFQQPMLRDLVRVLAGQDPREPEGLDDSLRWLRQARFELLILHEGALPPATAPAVRAWLDERLGEPERYEQDAIAVYDLARAIPTTRAAPPPAQDPGEQAFAAAVAAMQGFLRSGDAALLDQAEAGLEQGAQVGSPTDRHRAVLLGAALRVLRGQPHGLIAEDQRMALAFLLPAADDTQRLAAALRAAAGSKDESVVYRQLLGGKFCAQQSCPTRDDDLGHILAAVGVPLRPGMVVADIGSGVGSVSVALARELGPDGLVYAVDVDPGVIAFMEQALPGLPEGSRVRPVRSAPGDISVPAGSLDLALANGV